MIGNLFIPQDFKEGDVSLPAVLVAGAMTGVKEQSYSNSTPATICYFSRLSIHRPEIIPSYNLSKTNKRSNSPSSTLDR